MIIKFALLLIRITDDDWNQQFSSAEHSRTVSDHTIQIAAAGDKFRTPEFQMTEFANGSLWTHFL